MVTFIRTLTCFHLLVIMWVSATPVILFQVLYKHDSLYLMNPVAAKKVNIAVAANRAN